MRVFPTTMWQMFGNCFGMRNPHCKQESCLLSNFEPFPGRQGKSFLFFFLRKRKVKTQTSRPSTGAWERLLNLRNSPVGTYWGNSSPHSESLRHRSTHPFQSARRGQAFHLLAPSWNWENSELRVMFRHVPKRDEWEAEGRQLLRTDRQRNLRGVGGGCTVSEGDRCVLRVGDVFPREGPVELAPALSLSANLPWDPVTPCPCVPELGGNGI